MPAMVFEDGIMKEVPAASGAIRYAFPDPIGEQEAFYTLHSEAATLSKTIPGVRDVRWRLALPSRSPRASACWSRWGWRPRSPRPVGGGTVVPRDLLIKLLNRLPESEEAPHDVECLDVRVEGIKDGAPATVFERAMFHPTHDGLSAGSFGTAIPIATMARWQAGRRVGPGVHPPELAVRVEEFLVALEAEGVFLP